MGELEWQVGEVVIRRVEARVTAVPHGSLSTAITPEVVDEHRPWIDPFVAADGRILLSVHSFVITAGATTIVVDTCVGDHGERPLPNDPEFPGRLAAAIVGGLDAVDVVVCTHLHFDHVGWNTRRDPTSGRLVPTFPNARYLVSRTEYDAAREHHGIGHDILGVSITPLVEAGRFDPVDADHRISDTVRLVPTHGHSPGHVSVLVESNGERALITGDIVHTPIQFVRPDITADRFDHDPVAARATRRRVIDDVADGATLVLGTHFPPPTAGRVHRSADGTVTFEPCSIKPGSPA